MNPKTRLPGARSGSFCAMAASVAPDEIPTSMPSSRAARRALDRAFYELLACTMEVEIEAAGNVRAAKAAGAHVAKILAKYG